MATTHVPGTGFTPRGGKHVLRAAIIAAVVLGLAATVVPFAVHGLDRDSAQASPATRVTHPSASTHPSRRHPVADSGLGPRGDLPRLLPASTRLTVGTHVRVGDITSGVLRRTPEGRWRVLVRWDGKIQPVPTRGPVRLRSSTVHGPTSWVSHEGLLYTRVPTGGGQFRVYAWHPQGATAYTPPTLVAHVVGRVCFNSSFTAFGNCRA